MFSQQSTQRPSQRWQKRARLHPELALELSIIVLMVLGLQELCTKGSEVCHGQAMCNRIRSLQGGSESLLQEAIMVKPKLK